MNYVGIDGGGTKTLFRLTDEELNPLREIELETSHFGQVGYDGMKAVLRQGIESVLSGRDDETVLSFGLAGYGQVPEIRARIEQVVSEAAGGRRFILNNDSQIAAFGALGGQDGIVMVAGTGSIAIAYKDGGWYRRGGFGYLIDDGGSAYDIGRNALRVYARMAEGLIPKDALYDVITEACSLAAPTDLIAVMFERAGSIRTETAKFAALVGKASRAGSSQADRLLAGAAAEHAVFIRDLMKLFDGDVPISYIGGVYQAGDRILGPLETLGIRMRQPLSDSCTGAILLGKAAVLTEI